MRLLDRQVSGTLGAGATARFGATGRGMAASWPPRISFRTVEPPLILCEIALVRSGPVGTSPLVRPNRCSPVIAFRFEP